MKIQFLTILMTAYSSFTFGQDPIDSTNYYNHYNMKAHYQNSNVETHHLEMDEVSQIAYEEMENLDFERLFKHRIVKLDSSQYVLPICYSETSHIGFLFEEIWGMVPEQKNRYVKSLYKSMMGFDYSEKIVAIDGESEFIKIKELPEGLHILKAENYWYQTSKDWDISSGLVSKSFIIQLLREDIRKALNK